LEPLALRSKLDARRWKNMRRIHALGIALLLAIAAGLGLAAATKTAGLRKATAPAAHSAIVARSRRLDRVEAALRRALRDKPPALPPLGPRPAPAVAATPRVVYRRPAPIVVLKHSTHRDSEHKHETESGGDD
jgi:hypothetical protein